MGEKYIWWRNHHEEPSHETDSIIQLVLALIPFVSLFGGFLIFHWGSLKTVFLVPVWK